MGRIFKDCGCHKGINLLLTAGPYNATFGIIPVRAIQDKGDEFSHFKGARFERTGNIPVQRPSIQRIFNRFEFHTYSKMSHILQHYLCIPYSIRTTSRCKPNCHLSGIFISILVRTVCDSPLPVIFRSNLLLLPSCILLHLKSECILAAFQARDIKRINFVPLGLQQLDIILQRCINPLYLLGIGMECTPHKQCNCKQYLFHICKIKTPPPQRLPFLFPAILPPQS